MSRKRRVLYRHILPTIVLATLLPSSALAATAHDICARTLQGQEARSAAYSDLQSASRRAEAVLDGPSSDLLRGDRALESLEVSSLSAGAPDHSAIAAYCNAAGEAMRIARSGSGSRARDYFLTALAEAELAENANLRGKIAYRLALVSRNFATRPNAQSARRSISNNAENLAPPIDQNTLESWQCGSLLAPSFEGRSNWAASQLALDCAVESATDAQDDLLMGLAHLQSARGTLAEANRRSGSRQELQQRAGQASLEGFDIILGSTELAQSFELAARLVESALDAGLAGDNELQSRISRLRAVVGEDPGELALIDALQGRFELGQGAHDQAAGLLRRAIFYESQRAQPIRLADWYLLLAKADPANRAQHIMQAYRALEAVRSLLPTFDPLTEESLFQLRMRPVFSAAVELQLSDDAPETGDDRLLLAQQIVESFRQAEIQNVFGEDCVPPRIPVAPSDLIDGEVLLYPIILPDRVELLYVAKTAGNSAPTYQRISQSQGADRETIEELVNKANFELGYGLDDSWKTPTAQLYQILIKPIEDQLSENSTLIIVPDGVLRRLPFSALRDEQGTLLIEKTGLTIAPSLAYTQPGERIDNNAQVVAASLSKKVDLPVGSFAALKGTNDEARMASGFGDAEADSGTHLQNFTRADLQQAFASQQVDILHLATHASFNGRSDRSFIVANNQAILLAELREMIASNRTNGELLSLIILSACETALGDDQASMGLAGSAVQAGAESALASLWEVDDAGTAELMRLFYVNYAQGQGKAEALRNAQLALIRSDGNFADPRIWAAFTLLGAWR